MEGKISVVDTEEVRMIWGKQKNEDDKKTMYKQRREMRWLRRNKITSWPKIGPPWSHFKASLMILIS